MREGLCAMAETSRIKKTHVTQLISFHFIFVTHLRPPGR